MRTARECDLGKTKRVVIRTTIERKPKRERVCVWKKTLDIAQKKWNKIKTSLLLVSERKP